MARGSQFTLMVNDREYATFTRVGPGNWTDDEGETLNRRMAQALDTLHADVERWSEDMLTAHPLDS